MNIYIYMYVCVCACMHIYIYIYILWMCFFWWVYMDLELAWACTCSQVDDFKCDKWNFIRPNSGFFPIPSPSLVMHHLFVCKLSYAVAIVSVLQLKNTMVSLCCLRSACWCCLRPQFLPIQPRLDGCNSYRFNHDWMVAKSCTLHNRKDGWNPQNIQKSCDKQPFSTGAGFRWPIHSIIFVPQKKTSFHSRYLQISLDLLIAMHHSHELVCAGLRSDIEEGAVDAGDPFDQRGFTCHLMKDDWLKASQFNSFFFLRLSGE